MTVYIVFWEVQDSGSEFDRAYLSLGEAQVRAKYLNSLEDSFKERHVVTLGVEE